MLITSSTAGPVATAGIDAWMIIAAAVGLVATVLYRLLGRRYLNADDDWWERVRDRVWPLANDVPGPIHGEALNRASPDTYVATVHKRPEAFERDLVEMGFHRNPVAGYKTGPLGREEAGSWALREGMDDDRQLHVTIFERGGDTDVHAHEEASSINPETARDHLEGDGYSAADGVGRMRSLLDAHSVSHDIADDRYSSSS